MALGPFAEGFGRSLSLGAQLGLQYQREAREQERFAYLKQKDDRDQGLKVIESLGNIYKQQTSPAVKKAQAGFLFNHLEKATGQPIHPEIRELFKKANDEDVGMILNQATTMFKTDPTMGISLLMQGLGMDANKAMDYFVNYGKLQEQQLDYQANIEAGLGPAPTTPVQAPAPPAPQAPTPLAMQGPTRYRAMAEDVARRRGIPVNIFASLIQQESAWNPQARSSAGAVGLGQLMPGTAQELGVDPSNVQQNLEGAATYLRQQYDKYGDWGKALTAYHSGPGNVDRGTIGPVGQRYAPEVLARAGATAPTPAVTPEIRAIDEAIGGLEADVDRWRTLRGTTQIKERIANAEQKITRLQTRRGQLQTGQHQAVTEAHSEARLAQERRPSEPEAQLNRLTELETGGQYTTYQAAPIDIKARVAERSQQLAVERTAPKTLPTSLIEDLRETEKAVLQVEAQARDYKPTYTGPTHGRVAEWISDPLGYTSDEEYRWSIGVQSLNNRYISKYMGATVPPAEFARAKAVLINRTDTPKAVRQKLRVMQDELKADLAASRKALQQSGYGGLPAAQQVPSGRGPVEVMPGTTVEELP